MVNKDPRLVTVRRSTVVRAGMAIVVLAALGVGIAVGLTVGSGSPGTNHSSVTGISTTTGGGSTAAAPLTTSTTAAGVPSVLSCGPGSTAHVRPATLTVPCTTKATTVTGITWSAWAAAAGGQGTGTLNTGIQSAPAVVVVFHEVNGVFQDVSITPAQDASTTTPTTLPAATRTSATTAVTTTTATSPGGIAAVAASQPGSGWGGQ